MVTERFTATKSGQNRKRFIEFSTANPVIRVFSKAFELRVRRSAQPNT